MINIRDDYRRLSNLLMVGHGGALLVAFNARVQGAIESSEPLQAIAIWFSIGLGCAFLMTFVIFRYDETEQAKSVLLNVAGARNEQLDRIRWTARWFFMSAGMFVVGLFSAINLLGPPPETAPIASPLEPAAVSSEPSPSTAAVESSAQP